MLAPLGKPDHWIYAGSAVFFLGVSWKLIRWVFRTSAELSEPPASQVAMTEEEMRALAKVYEAKDREDAGEK